MIAKIHIDLSRISTKNELFAVFASTFSFPTHFGYNWDALYDMMSSLDPDAEIFHSMKSPLIGVHLIFEGFDIFEESFSGDDLERLRAMLVDLSVSRDFRPDHLSFTFEIRYCK
jgi:hypothetical protein